MAGRAGVAVSLVYYHFDSREGLLKAAMDYSNDQSPMAKVDDSHYDCEYAALEAAMVAELGDSPEIRGNAVVWNELTASAVFDANLRSQVSDVTRRWIQVTAEWIRAGQRDGSIRTDADAQQEAELLTSLLDGLATRWISGTLSLSRARTLLKLAVRERLIAAEADEAVGAR